MLTFREFSEAIDCYPNCTNHALTGFGLGIQRFLDNVIAALDELRRAGWVSIDFERIFHPILGSSNTIYPDPSNPSLPRIQYNVEKIKKDFPTFKPGMTVSKMMNTFKKGRYLVGTTGHLMSLINGELFDFAGEFSNRRRVNNFYLVLKKSEWKKFKKKYVREYQEKDDNMGRAFSMKI